MEIQVIKPTQIGVRKLRVCAYCRVSTSDNEQENSLENQVSHYEEYIKSNPMYEFVNVYYDFGISGFKEKRPGFQQMMKDAREGKIDLIIAKSVSRFARNTVTVLKAARELKEMGIGIFFEIQNINTLTEAGELMLTIISAFAQAESENYSHLSKMGIQRKYEKGEPIQRLERCFGYTKDENGKYIVDKQEGVWVKKMYQLIAEGYTPAEVRRFLNENNVKTTAGAAFVDSTVTRIIESEIYKGDFVMHKHFVNADRKEVKNEGQVDSWYITDDHPAIVSRKLWDKAQKALERKRAYLAEGSIVGENTEETYPYKNKIYCSYCGHPLYRRVYSNGNRVNWGCSGQKRYFKGFCEGINVPDSVIRSWGKIDENIYIRERLDKMGRKSFKYSTETAWKRKNKRKEKDGPVPLNEENYPHYKKIFCKECGSRLVRLVNATGQVIWICNGTKRKGTSFCKGVRVPDEVIRGWDFDTDILVEGKESKNGKKCYSYTSKAGK
jgi:DNA invertase Pin-like site-specific DNA recombinase